MWTAAETNIAVVCACIPSFRPLIGVLSRGFSHSPSVRDTSNYTSRTSSKGLWKGRVRQNDTDFSQLDDADDSRPLGHDVSVRAGSVNNGQGDVETMEMPQNGITVKREITIVTSNRLDYDDRLF